MNMSPFTLPVWNERFTFILLFLFPASKFLWYSLGVLNLHFYLTTHNFLFLIWSVFTTYDFLTSPSLHLSSHSDIFCFPIKKRERYFFSWEKLVSASGLCILKCLNSNVTFSLRPSPTNPLKLWSISPWSPPVLFPTQFSFHGILLPGNPVQ